MKSAAIVILVGLAIVFGGVYYLNTSAPSRGPVTCNGTVMHEHDICKVDGRNRSKDEQADHQNTAGTFQFYLIGYGLIVAGAIACFFGLAMGISAKDDRRREARRSELAAEAERKARGKPGDPPPA